MCFAVIGGKIQRRLCGVIGEDEAIVFRIAAAVVGIDADRG